MQRYVNPHPTMFPQQQVPQQQVMQPQIMMTPQGPMMMTPQGMVPVQVTQMQGQPQVMQGGMQGQFPQQFPQMQGQGGMMVQHGGMQGQFPQGQFPQQQFPTQQQYPSNNQSVVQSRFGQPSTTMEPTTQLQDSGNRYGTFQSPQQAQQQVQQPQQVEEPIRPALFIVTPTTHKFTGNEKFKMGVITEAVKANNIAYEEGFVACNCLEETVEDLIEMAYKPDTAAMVTVRNYIVNNSFYRVDLREVMTNLVAKDTKNLYKVFKAQYTKLTDKHQINVLNSLNTMLTDVINDFLTVNSVSMISIESFYTDYNDLLKVIGSTEEDLEEVLTEYLDKYVADLKTSLTNTTKTENATQITEVVSIAYVDRLVQETGLDVIGQAFVQVDDSIANTFLKTLAAEVIAKIAKQEFLLVTLDKRVFKFMVSSNADVYVKNIA